MSTSATKSILRIQQIKQSTLRVLPALGNKIR